MMVSVVKQGIAEVVVMELMELRWWNGGVGDEGRTVKVVESILLKVELKLWYQYVYILLDIERHRLVFP